MSCYNPKRGFFTPHGLKVVPWDVEKLVLLPDGAIVDPRDLPETHAPVVRELFDWMPIPCGKCLACRLQYSKEWTARLMAESQDWPDAEMWFLTLTYDDEHLPLTGYSIVDTGEATGEFVPTLVPKHLSDFWKRLRITCQRRGWSDSIRYFAAGEYGSHTYRPHYHAIVFGLPLGKDGVSELSLNLWSKTARGDLLFTSPLFEKLWPFGRVMIGHVSRQSMSYVARYCLKKIYDEFDPDTTALRGVDNRVPEFTRASRRPGIGLRFIESHPEMFENTSLVFGDGDGSFVCSFPRAYLKKLRVLDEDRYNQIISDRRTAAILDYQNKVLTGRDYLDILKSEEYIKTAKTKKLVRPL